MDYKRIYDEFIKDRRSKERDLTGYSERHHIVPRCIGGGDDAANLIRLTPEDHFFAHLLLAKFHGGRMWAAVHAMSFLAVGNERRLRLSARIKFGHVRPLLSGILSGASLWSVRKSGGQKNLHATKLRRWRGERKPF